MEDLIEIKTKKEQTMTDLENLKSEIIKNKTFLQSLEEINQRDKFRLTIFTKSTHVTRTCN